MAGSHGGVYAAKVKSLVKRYGCTLERVPQGNIDDPNLEILAPEGFWFESEGTHTLLAHGWGDAHVRLSGAGAPVKCPGDCCKEPVR